MINPLHSKDFYKASHVVQYPKNTTLVYSNLTPRSGNYRTVPGDKVVFFGLQLFIKDYLIKDWNEQFFNKPKDVVCGKYHRRIKNAISEIDISHIESLHDLGYLPIKIKALPEGSCVDYKIPVMTIYNTLPDYAWLTNMLESVLSNETWPTMSSATIANEFRKLYTHYGNITCDTLDHIPFQGHDFSFRGMMGRHAGMISGLGHLASGLVGTDTVLAIDAAEEYYNSNSDEELVGASVPASEHSVMCAGGKSDEILTYKRFINDLYPSGIVSIVSDTWSLWDVVNKFLPKLKDDIMSRDGTLVIRPDSGDPIRIIAGYTEDEIYRGPQGTIIDICTKMSLEEHEVKGLIQCLWDIFGGTISKSGYNILDSHIGAIYGDSITFNRAQEILERLKDKKFASSNIVFGHGSFLYQLTTRDWAGLAVKATYVEVNGEGREIFKDPKTDNGTKKSAKGLLMVIQTGKTFELKDQVSKKEEARGALETVFKDSHIVKEYTLNDIRQRVRTFD